MADYQTGSFTPTIAFQNLADAVAMDASLKGVIYSQLLQQSALEHNAFEKFTSEADTTGMVGAGVRSIFARKNDLSKGNAASVVFSVVGPPGGPGAIGNQTLVGRTSQVKMKTFAATVAWHRDAISFDAEILEFLSTSKKLESTALNMLAMKMGIHEQNHMVMRLRTGATSFNTYRPGNRTSTAGLLPEDTLSLDYVVNAKTRLSTIGGKPIMQSVGKTGYPIKGYLTFGTDNSFRPLRNDDSFKTILAQGDTRGDQNSLFTGELLNWQNMPFYEFPSLDMAWDDYIGNALTPKAVVGQALSRSAVNLLPNPSNTVSQYLQFFPNAPYNFDGTYTTPVAATDYYAWIINPDGSVGFVAYQDGFTNGANGVALTKILSTNTTGINEKSVGEVVARTSATTGGDGTYTPTVGETNLPTGWTYTDQFVAGAIVLPANAKGTVIGYGFVFGAMSACFATGRVKMNPISQDEDFEFIQSRGYASIMGTCTTLDPNGNNAGYLLAEHAVEHEGLPTPLVVI